MREGVNVFLGLAAAAAVVVLFPAPSLGAGGEAAGSGEDRWVPSLSIITGVTFQDEKGSSTPLLFEDMGPDPVALRFPIDGDDLAVTPFVGATVELLTPAIPIPLRPRFFLNGEILPSFATDRNLANDGQPTDCIRSPLPEAGGSMADCARDQMGEVVTGFSEDSANGQGQRVTSTIDTLVWGANAGLAFPVQFLGRQLRIKPSFSWINYKVEASGLVVDAMCRQVNLLVNRCTDTVTNDGFLRETILSAEDSRRFNGIGPGLDVEMDTGRFGPIGTSLFIGGRAYYTLGDRTIAFSATESFDDEFGMDTAVGLFEVEVDEWMFRASLGLRFHWLGRRK